MFFLILEQSLKLSFRKGGGAMGACAFYVIVVTLFTFALGVEAMNKYAVAIMCVAMLLSIVTALPLLFERDYEDGSLEQFILQPVPLELLVFAKILGQYLAHILPILLISPLLALFANLSADETISALTALLAASPALMALGAVSAAVTLGSKRGGLLQALLVMPLYIPVLIFACADGGVGMWFLAAISCFIVPITCLICTALIRVSVD